MITGANANLCWSQMEKRGQQVIPAADVPQPLPALPAGAQKSLCQGVLYP